jgi:hypothetical protein
LNLGPPEFEGGLDSGLLLERRLYRAFDLMIKNFPVYTNMEFADEMYDLVAMITIFWDMMPC